MKNFYKWINKWENNYIEKKLKELDEHPELNKNGKITQAQTEKIVKFILFIIMICFFIFLCIFRASYTQKIRGY